MVLLRSREWLLPRAAHGALTICPILQTRASCVVRRGGHLRLDAPSSPVRGSRASLEHARSSYRLRHTSMRTLVRAADRSLVRRIHIQRQCRIPVGPPASALTRELLLRRCSVLKRNCLGERRSTRSPRRSAPRARRRIVLAAHEADHKAWAIPSATRRDEGPNGTRVAIIARLRRSHGLRRYTTASLPLRACGCAARLYDCTS